MASFEQTSLCTIEEYRKACTERLMRDQLENGVITMLLLRLKYRKDALKIPVEVIKTPDSKLGNFALDILVLNDDLKPMRKTPVSGLMPDGIWNSGSPDDGIVYRARGVDYEGLDGVFRPYDDGLDMGMFEGMFAISGSSRSLY